MRTTDEPGGPGVTTFEMPSDAEVRITRVVAAPKRLVFDAHTAPEHVSRWMLGPPGWTMPVCEIDLRPGGAYRYVWQAGDGAEMTIAGTYQEIVRPDLLVSTETWSGQWPPARNTVTFHEHDGRTRITTTVRYSSPAARDAALRGGMRDGMAASHARLDAYLAGLEPAPPAFDMRLELVPVPVRDVDASIAFYRDLLGFTLDHDIRPGNGMRVTQLTPPGSACSILLSQGPYDQPPGTLRGLHLVVKDAHKARETLLARGVEVGGVDDMGGVLYVGFADPDGNTWMLQEIPPGLKPPADD